MSAIIEFRPRAKVFVEKGRAWVTSLDVAEDFEMDHKHVLDAIRKLKCSEEFRSANFSTDVFKDSYGRDQPMYRMTRDGFTFLAMGFTGEKPAKFKEGYIALFNEYEGASLDWRAWAIELRGLTESLTSSVGSHEYRVNGLEQTVYEDHEKRLLLVERKTKDKKAINPATKKAHDRFVCYVYKNHCPMCGQVAVKWEYDHGEDIEKPDKWHTWKICLSCHDKLTFNEEMRTQIRLTDFATYQRRLRAWKPTLSDILGTKPLFSSLNTEAK